VRSGGRPGGYPEQYGMGESSDVALTDSKKGFRQREKERKTRQWNAQLHRPKKRALRKPARLRGKRNVETESNALKGGERKERR